MDVAVSRNRISQEQLSKSHRAQVEGVLADFGLDAECMKSKPLSISHMVNECRQEEKKAPVEEPEVLASSSSNSDDVDVDGVKLTGYTIGIIVIFCLQIFFCIGICFYSQGQVAKAKKESIEQQAQFYQFLFQFHKQMADEEAAMGRRSTGTPGGKRD